MCRISKSVYFTLLIFIFSITHVEALKVNLFTDKNGKGLEVDQKILAKALSELGHEVECKTLFDVPDSSSYADVNIFFQVIVDEWVSYAKQNWFIPNPEWFYGRLEQLELIDLVLCRTREVQRIFKSLDQHTYYLGFTSFDCYDPTIKKDFSTFFHLAGESAHKGTGAILKVWRHHSSFPLLIGIQRWGPAIERGNIHWINERVDDARLRHLQNTCGFHLCPSETEGFGHYIMEAMSACAVVITTDAPPMNEFIKDLRCLVHYDRQAPLQLGMNYYVNPYHLELIVSGLSNLPRQELLKIGIKNRLMYLKKTKAFKQRLKKLMTQTSTYLDGE